MPPIPKQAKMLKPSEAAEILGCTTRHVRILVQSGKLKDTEQVPDSNNRFGYCILIPLSEVQRYQKLKFSRGWKRGKKHSKRS